MSGRIGVVGFGKIGQALAAAFLRKGARVVAVDANPELVASLAEGCVETNEPGVAAALGSALETGNLVVTSQPQELRDARAVLVAIPLLVDSGKQVLLEPFLRCLEDLAPFLSGRALLSVETSVPVGASRGPILASLERSGRRHGIDFLLVHSPERIKSGSMLAQLETNPKLVGGLDDEALEAGLALYREFLGNELVQPVTSIEAAELVKLAGMVYRDVNIALVNELAGFASARGIDLGEVIRWANTDGEAHLLAPGIGVGGHCTPVYPHFLIANFRENGLRFQLAETGRTVNDSMPEQMVARVAERWPLEAAAILGLGFRPDVKEDAFSVAYPLRDALRARGVKVWLHDPLYRADEIRARGFEPLATPGAETVDAVFLTTHHSEYRDLDLEALGRAGCRVFIDGRDALEPDRVRAAGLEYLGIGRSR